MDFLAFRPYSPIACWGDTAVGGVRPTHDYPGRSAVLGLLAAALGIERDEQTRLDKLRDSLGLAVAVYSVGELLRDYHTVQVPGASQLRKRPHRTRADELMIARSDLHTLLSSRDYRQDALSVVLLWRRDQPEGPSLLELQQALRKPKFLLYLGRKSCPPAIPLAPTIISANSLAQAIEKTAFPAIEGLKNVGQLRRVAYDESLPVPLGIEEATVLTTVRKDEPGVRQRWQFSDRVEHVALIPRSDSSHGVQP